MVRRGRFELLDVIDDGVELVVDVETTATPVGCPACGVRATPKDRRWVTLRDAPSGDRAVQLRWRKRIWSCDDVDCEVRTWTEQASWPNRAGCSPPERVGGRRRAWAPSRDDRLDRPQLRRVVVDGVVGRRAHRPGGASTTPSGWGR